MHEKSAIIQELLTQARIYLDEQVEMVIKTVQEYDEVPDSCPKCEGHVKEIYERCGREFDLIVLKCDIFFAFWVQPFTFEPFFESPAKEDEHGGGRIIEPSQWKYAGKPQWGEGRQPKFPKETAKAYRRAVSQLNHRNKRLNHVIRDKLTEMYSAGLSNETITSARNRVLIYLRNNSLTEKQLVAMFAAAVYETSHEDILVAVPSRFQRVGEKISERRLEKIFGVTRKTIRKWRRLLASRKQFISNVG